MAIKIIKEGKNKIAVYRANCSNCDCEFEFNKEDAFFGMDRDGKYLNLNCPHCKANIHSRHVNPYRYDIVKP